MRNAFLKLTADPPLAILRNVSRFILRQGGKDASDLTFVYFPASCSLTWDCFGLHPSNPEWTLARVPIGTVNILLCVSDHYVRI